MTLHKVGRGVLAAIALLCAAALAQVPVSQHVVLVIDENSSYSDVMANMPWLVGQGNTHGYATNYKSNNGGSLLDYLWLASGSCESSANCALPAGTHNFYCNGNDCYYPNTANPDPITDDNIFRQLNKAGISWKVYAQSYAAAGGTPNTPDNANGTDYYRRHNGAVWYSDILSNVDGSASKIVDLSRLATDVKNNALPRFMIIVPDGHHDAHDCPVGMGSCTEAQKLAAADQFLSANLGPILAMPAFQSGGSGLALVTFDECGGGTDAGCGASVYTALMGPKVKPHTESSVLYHHQNALRTILDSLGIKTYPGASATAADMSDFFEASTGSPDVHVTSPVSGATMGSPVPIDASASPSPGHSISAWAIYVDSKNVYSGGAATFINPNIAMATGSHNVVVRAWDTSGAYGDQSLSITANTSKPSVSISTPVNSAIVGSPVNLKASGTPSTGQKIVGWWVYVDSVGKYKAGAVNFINTNLTLATGKHTVVVRTWDSSGAYGDRTISVNAQPGVTVKVTAPKSGGTYNPKMLLTATASSGNAITGWRVYVDSVSEFSKSSAESISTYLTLTAGTHTLVVRAWNTTGAYGDQTIKVTTN